MTAGKEINMAVEQINKLPPARDVAEQAIRAISDAMIERSQQKLRAIALDNDASDENQRASLHCAIQLAAEMAVDFLRGRVPLGNVSRQLKEIRMWAEVY